MEVPLTTASTGALDSDVSSDYGEKKITTFQSICLLLNNVTGAAMVLYPGLLQQAGWLAPTVCMCVIASLTAVSGLCLVKTMQICPGNERYQQRYEFMNVAKQLFTPTQYKIVFCFFILSLFSSVIPLIIQSAQVMDFTLVALFSKTCGLQFSPSFQWICSSDSTNNVDPFGADVVILSVGVLVLAALCIPVGMWNLDDNMIIQTVATCFMLLIIGIWCGFFTTLGLNVDNMPMLGTDYSQVLGIVVFNYTFITCLPSWINEKAPEVNITRSIVYSLTGATAVFIVLGVMGALAYAPFFNTDADVLDKLNQSGNSLIRVTYFLFPIVVNLTSIPIFSIVIKYNLLSNHICSKSMANFLAVVVPWILTVPFYCGQGFNRIVTWTGIFTQSIVNFIVPMYMYIVAVRKFGNERGYISADLSGGKYHSYGSIMYGSPIGSVGASSIWSKNSLNHTAPSSDDFLDPLFACSSENQYDNCLPRHRCPGRISWAWCVLGLLAVFMVATLAVNIYNSMN